jgi:hypothetical protein
MWGKPRFGYSGVCTFWRSSSPQGGIRAAAIEEGLLGSLPPQIEGEAAQRICFPRREVEQR